MSRPSGHEQYQSDDEEEDPDDEAKMSEGEGRDEAREDEPEHDKDDSEDDHDVYLVSVRMFWRRVLRVNDGTHHLAWPTTGLALPPADQRVLRRTGGYLELVVRRIADQPRRAKCACCLECNGTVSECSAGADAHQVQRRTAKLFPNGLEDSATATLHLLGTPGHTS